LRQYLNDRHTRRQDKDYRETAEKRLLELERLSRESKVIAECIEIAKGAGATKNDLAPLLDRLVYGTLMALDRYQDHHVIENAEISYELNRGRMTDLPSGYDE
jgi:hypothetical protein